MGQGLINSISNNKSSEATISVAQETCAGLHVNTKYTASNRYGEVSLDSTISVGQGLTNSRKNTTLVSTKSVGQEVKTLGTTKSVDQETTIIGSSNQNSGLQNQKCNTNQINYEVNPIWDVNKYISAQSIIEKSGLPNARGCKIPIPTTLNIDFLEKNLLDFEDKEVIEFMKYGWPLSTSYTPENEEIPRNHKSALDHPDDIEKFLKKAEKIKSLLGPLERNPFMCKMFVSPIGSLEKSNTTERRKILDCSCPKTRSVNDAIEKYMYLGEPYKLTYPGVDDLVKIVKAKGKGCALFKRDLKSAYRQLLRLDPKDIPLVAFTWNGEIYFDLTQPQGCIPAALACQRTSNALVHIYKKMNKGNEAVNYLDDLGGADVWENDKAYIAFRDLGKVLKNANIEEAESKAHPPSTQMIFLGVLFNTDDLTLSISAQRLIEIKQLMGEWIQKNQATKKQLQSLIGVLKFVAACVIPGRSFFARMYFTMKTTPDQGLHPINKSFFKDLIWWNKFITKYNGVSMMSSDRKADVVFTSDSCMSACGGWLPERREFFKAIFPKTLLGRAAKAAKMKSQHINQLELVTILIVCKIWGKHWSGKKILAKCDNQASVEVIKSGRSLGDEYMMDCMREIAYCAACNEFEITAVHLPGQENSISDHLSRWFINPKAE